MWARNTFWTLVSLFTLLMPFIYSYSLITPMLFQNKNHDTLRTFFWSHSDSEHFGKWSNKARTKELSLCHKLKYWNPYIFRIQCCKPLIVQTQIIWFNRIHSLKYLRSTTFGSKDIAIRIFKFVAKTQFL